MCTLRNIFTACTRTCCLYNEKLILFLSIELLLKELVRYLSGFGLFLEELKKSSVSFLFIELKLTKLPVPRLFCLALNGNEINKPFSGIPFFSGHNSMLFSVCNKPAKVGTV